MKQTQKIEKTNLEVMNFLKAIEFAEDVRLEYYSLFLEHHLDDLKTIFSLTVSDIAEMKISIGHRNKIIEAIEKGKHKQDNQPPTTSTAFFDRQLIESQPPTYTGVVDLLKNFQPQKSCKEYVKSLDKKTIPKLDFIVEEVDYWLEFKLKGNNPNNLTVDEIYAIGLYTWDLNSNGKKEDNFYYILNKLLIERKPKSIQEWEGYLYYLQKGLLKIPDISQPVYRGIPDISIIQQNYSMGTKVHWSGYSSTTSSIQKAMEFADTNGVVMIIHVLNGKNISKYSTFQNEDEVLLSPNLRLVVSRDLYEKDGVKFVELVQEKVGPTFVF